MNYDKNSGLFVVCALSLSFNGSAATMTQPQFSLGPYTSIQVNVDAQGKNIRGDAANETTIAVNSTNPDNIVIGWKQFATVQSSSVQGGWAYSLNAGLDWIFPGVLPLTGSSFRTDPVLGVDSQGTFYYQSLHHGAPETARTDIFKSTDGGMTWQNPVKAFDGDKNWMAIDRTGGASDGFIYSIWRSGSNPNHFTRSINQGISFETPVKVPRDPGFGRVAVAPNGDVYTVGRTETNHLDPNEPNKLIFDAFLFAKSTNAKDSSTTPSFTTKEIDMGGFRILPFFPIDSPNQFGGLGDVQLAIDHSQTSTRGNIYVAATLDPPGIDHHDLHLIRSSDGGATWSTPVRVNDDLPAENSWQWFPTMDVAPNSRIDLVWFDTRNSNNGAKFSELFYAYSWDAGRTWSKNIPVSLAFSTNIGFPQGSTKFGDYIDGVSDASGINIAYPATFNGEQDIYFVHLFPDCNSNGLSDVDDINQGTSQDNDASHIPDECEAQIIEGDLDADGDVDIDDMRIILASRNQPATDPNDPKDINGDGTITVRDARSLKHLCTRPRCATQ